MLPDFRAHLLLFPIPERSDDWGNPTESRAQARDHQEQNMEFLRLVRIVLTSFFGVRKRASHESDFANVNIVLLPFVALLMAFCIGAAIFGVVHLVAHATATVQGF
jgi:hypothetical protein